MPADLVQTQAIQGLFWEYNFDLKIFFLFSAEFVRALMAIKQAREGIAIVPMPSFNEYKFQSSKL